MDVQPHKLRQHVVELLHGPRQPRLHPRRPRRQLNPPLQKLLPRLGAHPEQPRRPVLASGEVPREEGRPVGVGLLHLGKSGISKERRLAQPYLPQRGQLLLQRPPLLPRLDQLLPKAAPRPPLVVLLLGAPELPPSLRKLQGSPCLLGEHPHQQLLREAL